VSRPKAKFEADSGEAFQLIWGDEVDTAGPEENGSVPVRYRGRDGTVPAGALDGEPRLECYFLDVGQGDATLIVTPGRKKILIDGGKTVRGAGVIGEAEQALIWKYRLDEAESPLVVDLVVLSHADEDHIGGLVNLVMNKRIEVRRVIHSGIATFNAGSADDELGERDTVDGTEYLVTRHSSLGELDGADLDDGFKPWVAALELEGVAYEAVEAGSTVDIGDPDILIEVLGPVVEHPDGYESGALRWLGDRAHTINGHSVVLRITYGDVRILLAGDINTEGARLLLADPVLRAGLDAHVLKAPHHGSHEYAPGFLAAVNPQITSISSVEIPDHAAPRANFLGAAGKYSRGDTPLLYSTALSAVFGKAELRAHQDAVDAVPKSTPANNSVKRELFHKLLPGIINIRTDGNEIYAATRVMTGYQWVPFGPVPASERSID
jgi:glyoxylase-like metal-dependent hydrolase (beta-lactamase superfamily II)